MNKLKDTQKIGLGMSLLFILGFSFYIMNTVHFHIAGFIVVSLLMVLIAAKMFKVAMENNRRLHF